MVLYVPLLASATLLRQSVFPHRRGWISFESGLLAWAVVILALTRSRISQFGFLAMSSIVLIVIGWKILGSIERRAGLTLPDGWSPRRIGLILLNTALLAALVAGLVLGAGRAAGRSDPRLWALESIRDRIADSRAFYPNEVTFAVGDRLAFAERLVYWTAAYRTFSLFPILGVGPGNAPLSNRQSSTTVSV
jgi:hypothetical protein